jgi:hypothetical protein
MLRAARLACQSRTKPITRTNEAKPNERAAIQVERGTNLTEY